MKPSFFQCGLFLFINIFKSETDIWYNVNVSMIYILCWIVARQPTVIQAVRALAETLWTSKKYNVFQTNIIVFTVVSSKVWKQFMKCNTKNRPLAGLILVFLIPRLINALLGPQNIILTLQGVLIGWRNQGEMTEPTLFIIDITQHCLL